MTSLDIVSKGFCRQQMSFGKHGGLIPILRGGVFFFLFVALVLLGREGKVRGVRMKISLVRG
jgi:hypothetical protein